MTKALLAQGLAEASDTHVVDVGRGALARSGATLRDALFAGGRPGLVVADERTWAAAGEPCRRRCVAAGVESVEPLVFPGTPVLYAARGEQPDRPRAARRDGRPRCRGGFGHDQRPGQAGCRRPRPALRGGGHGCFDGRLLGLRRADEFRRGQGDDALPCAGGGGHRPRRRCRRTAGHGGLRLRRPLGEDPRRSGLDPRRRGRHRPDRPAGLVARAERGRRSAVPATRRWQPATRTPTRDSSPA